MKNGGGRGGDGRRKDEDQHYGEDDAVDSASYYDEDDGEDDSGDDDDDVESFGIDDQEEEDEDDDEADDEIWEEDLHNNDRSRRQGHTGNTSNNGNGNGNVAFNNSLESLLTDLKGKYGTSGSNLLDDNMSGLTEEELSYLQSGGGGLVDATTAAVSKMRRSVIKKLNKYGGVSAVKKKLKKQKRKKKEKKAKKERQNNLEEDEDNHSDVEGDGQIGKQITGETSDDDGDDGQGQKQNGGHPQRRRQQQTQLSSKNSNMEIVVDRHHSHSHSPTSKTMRRKKPSWYVEDDGMEEEYEIQPQRPSSFSHANLTVISSNNIVSPSRKKKSTSNFRRQQHQQQRRRRGHSYDGVTEIETPEMFEHETSMFEIIPTTPTTYRNKSFSSADGEGEVDGTAAAAAAAGGRNGSPSRPRRRTRHKIQRRRSMSDFVPSSHVPTSTSSSRLPESSMMKSPVPTSRYNSPRQRQQKQQQQQQPSPYRQGNGKERKQQQMAASLSPRKSPSSKLKSTSNVKTPTTPNQQQQQLQRPISMRGSTHNTWNVPASCTNDPPFLSPKTAAASTSGSPSRSMRKRMMSPQKTSVSPSKAAPAVSQASREIDLDVDMPDDLEPPTIVPLKSSRAGNNEAVGAKQYGSPRRSKSPSRSHSSGRRRYYPSADGDDNGDNNNSYSGRKHSNRTRRKEKIEADRVPSSLSSPRRRMGGTSSSSPRKMHHHRHQHLKKASPLRHQKTAVSTLSPGLLTPDTDLAASPVDPKEKSSRSSSRRTRHSRSNRGSRRAPERSHSTGELSLDFNLETHVDESPGVYSPPKKALEKNEEKTEILTWARVKADPTGTPSSLLLSPSRNQERRPKRSSFSKTPLERSRSHDEELLIMAAETKAVNPKTEEQNRKFNLLLDSPLGHRKKKSLLGSSKKALMKKINQLTHSYGKDGPNDAVNNGGGNDISNDATPNLVIIPPFAASKKSAELLRGERRRRHRSVSPVKQKQDTTESVDETFDDKGGSSSNLMQNSLPPAPPPPFDAPDTEDWDPTRTDPPNEIDPVLDMLEHEVAFNNISVRSRSTSTKSSETTAAKSLSAKERHKLRHAFNNSTQSFSSDDGDGFLAPSDVFSSPPRRRLIANIHQGTAEGRGEGKSFDHQPHPSTPSTVAADSVTATIATPSLSSSSTTIPSSMSMVQNCYDECQVVMELPLNDEYEYGHDDSDDDASHDDNDRDGEDEEIDTIKDDGSGAGAAAAAVFNEYHDDVESAEEYDKFQSASPSNPLTPSSLPVKNRQSKEDGGNSGRSGSRSGSGSGSGSERSRRQSQDPSKNQQKHRRRHQDRNRNPHQNPQQLKEHQDLQRQQAVEHRKSTVQ